VISERALRALSGFHNRVARRLSGKMARQDPDSGEWSYPPLEEALEGAGLHKIEHYIGVRQRSFVQRIATRPMMDICEEMEDQGLPTESRLWWWTQRKNEVVEVEE